ncbi:MAG: metal ABC transporter ATP-binding protein [Bacillota bacterium]
METYPVVEISNLSFTYGCHPVLKDVSLTIMAGEAVGITGPNGAGKTTLVKILTGQIQPQSGEVRIMGEKVSGGGWRRRVGYVPQKVSYFNQGFPATVMEVVLSGRTARRGLIRNFGPEDRRAAEAAMEAMEISQFRNSLISSLSGGQQQRAFIARIMAAEPEMVIMDEPTVGIDYITSQRLYSIFRDINREKGMTIIMVSHDLEGIAKFITRQVCLNLHLCTCNSWGSAPAGARPANCGAAFPAFLNGSI